jgi:2-oxoglutarate dehydrogenase E1 component
MDTWRDFHGPNIGYVLELYDRYRHDPEAVDTATRAYFARWTPPPEAAAAMVPGVPFDKIVGAVNLAQAVRAYGHLAAQLDPLGSPPPGDPWLNPAMHGVTEDDLRRLPASLVGGPVAGRAANALEAIETLRTVYSCTIGYDFGHIHVPEERDWLRQAAESCGFCPPRDPIDPRALLERLTQVEVFERFLQRTFPGRTRFSIEGLDMLVPILDEIIGAAAESGIYHVLVGMAHRGRLNVLAHVLNLPYAQVLAGFKDPMQGHNFTIREDLSWTGDVRYHMGARRALNGGTPITVEVSMPPNSSHVESINPVVEGMARAAGTSAEQAGLARFDPCVSLPILIHGDAAFPGQGVVAETLNFSRLPGYHTGGTLHIITNNQLGYTTGPGDARSTLYASDLAKGFEIPIVHVNGDDPEACIEVARMAFAYRARFEKDFLIDLVGYRRHGHNEGDEPSFTQPLMYARVEGHPTVRELWANQLVQRGGCDPAWPGQLVEERVAELGRVLNGLHPEVDLAEPPPSSPPPGAARRVKTMVPAERLRELNAALSRLPEGFALNPKLNRILERRRRALDDLDTPGIDWATAEELALASILADGIPIRLTGEDVERGTFSQRHAVLYDVRTSEAFTPLQSLPQARAALAIYNSPLTENAAVGFEYGYNVQTPERLVIWEAQYGDFINSAQVVVDEFIVSGRAKWGQTPSLVLLLPHGFEGQGPDHSSGRMERFLQLAAEINLRIANCTTAAQYFHLLRRQAALLKTDPLPLVIMTPKSLLRHPRASSSLRELAEGRWRSVIDDDQARRAAESVRRLILCSGKVYVDLITSEQRDKSPAIALTRLEQLYPFPTDEVRSVLDGYPRLTEVIWLQEEPENMGAWRALQPRLDEVMAGRWPLVYIGRPPNSSPAEGSATWHAANQKDLVERAFTLVPDSPPGT